MTDSQEKPVGGIAARVAAAEQAKKAARRPAGATARDDGNTAPDTASEGVGSDAEQATSDKLLAEQLAAPLAEQPASNVRDRPASETASGTASSLLPHGFGTSVSLADLVGGGVDPDRDLVAAGARIPRYLKAALTSTAQLTRNSRTPLKEQDLLMAALLNYLPQNIVEQAYKNASSNRGFR